ncbi:MAG: RNA methyltransferase [Verrucomicrobiae bacterium]|nr:RNA methyltransferase [Verrucomicrobiae bacterium]
MTNPLEEYLTEFVSERRLKLLDRVLAQRTRHLTVVLEDFYKPHNASACLRSCDCFGVQDAYIIESYSQFKMSNNVAAGAGAWLTLYRYNGKTGDTRTCFDDLRTRGYRLYAADLSPDAVLIDELDISQPTAILFGSERRGISDFARKEVDGLVRIPVYGFTESLNVSVACALTLSQLANRLFHSDIHWQLSDEEKTVLWRLWLRQGVGHTWPQIEKEFFKRHPEFSEHRDEWSGKRLKASSRISR